MPQTPLAFVATNPAGAITSGRVGNERDLWSSQRHGRDYLAAYNGSVFVAANQSGVTTSAGKATTYVGFCLSNPAASGKNLAVLNVSGSFIVAPATVTGINLIAGYSAAGVVTHTTALAPLSSIIGGAAGVGLADSACTIVGTPAYIMPVSQTPVATTLPFFNVDIGGALIIPPGGYLAIGTTIAGPASGFMGGMIWEEINP